MKGAFGEMDKINNKVTDKNKDAMICSGHCFEWSPDILPVCETVPSLAY
jgi:hypothetical protein